MMWQDPIVAEIRRIREAHVAQHEGDLWAIYRDLQEQERQSPHPKVSFPPKRVKRVVVVPSQPVAA